MPDVIIISTGDELISGKTVDTNSAFISRLLSGTCFQVINHLTVSDNLYSIISALRESLDKADIVITTGGLGPTDDDNTVEAICSILSRKSIIDIKSKSKIDEYLASLNYQKNSFDYKMAEVPENSDIIHNVIGFAPGFIVSIEKKIIISVPGVPFEAEKMLTEHIYPYLVSKYNFKQGTKLTFIISGLRESEINKRIRDINLSPEILINITAKYFTCDVTITMDSDDQKNSDNIKNVIKDIFGYYLLDNNSLTPEQELVNLLKNNNFTISTAESCTGGLISKKITDIPGSSDVFIGGIVAYNNKIKESFLGVSSETLKKYGAVSENTAEEMATGIKKRFVTDIAISTTGIAGPGGGSADKPVGTVCFGFIIGNNVITETRFFPGDRKEIRYLTSLYAINYIRLYIKKTLNLL